jgi:hypothetical protein
MWFRCLVHWKDFCLENATSARESEANARAGKSHSQYRGGDFVGKNSGGMLKLPVRKLGVLLVSKRLDQEGGSSF